MDKLPVAVGLVQGEAHALGVLLLCRGVYKLDLVVGAHIAAHAQLPLAVIQPEGFPHQGQALGEGGVHGVHPAQQHKGRRHRGEGHRHALPHRAALFHRPLLQQPEGLV